MCIRSLLIGWCIYFRKMWGMYHFNTVFNSSCSFRNISVSFCDSILCRRQLFSVLLFLIFLKVFLHVNHWFTTVRVTSERCYMIINKTVSVWFTNRKQNIWIFEKRYYWLIPTFPLLKWFSFHYYNSIVRLLQLKNFFI